MYAFIYIHIPKPYIQPYTLTHHIYIHTAPSVLAVCIHGPRMEAGVYRGKASCGSKHTQSTQQQHTPPSRLMVDRNPSHETHKGECKKKKKWKKYKVYYIEREEKCLSFFFVLNGAATAARLNIRELYRGARGGKKKTNHKWTQQ